MLEMANDTAAAEFADIENMNDPYALAEIAAGAGSGEPDSDFNAEDELDTELDKAAEDDKAKADADKKEDADKKADGEGADDKEKDAKADDDGDGESDKKADADAEDGDEPAGVQAKDGKHTLPYSVLENTRKAKAALEARVKELEDEAAALREGKTTEAEAAKHQERIDRLQQLIDSAEEEYGEGLGAVLKETLTSVKDLTTENSELRKQIAEAAKARPAERDDDGGAAEIRQAMDATPEIAEWDSREDGTWIGRAVEVYQNAVAHNAEFASKSIPERFAALPGMVQTIYGRDPELRARSDVKKDAAPAKGDDAAKDTGKKADVDKAKPKEPEEKMPTSLSDIPGGSPEESGEFGPLEGMSGSAMVGHFGNMDSKKLEAFLSNLA